MAVFLSLFSFAYALVDYTPLAPLPGTTNGATTNLQTYLPGAFNLAVAVGAGLAFVYITIGGVMYATSDAISGKSQGKEYIQNALWGLLLVIGAWVILYTINPRLLEFNFTVSSPPLGVTAPTVGTVPSGVSPGSQTIANNVITSYGPCATGQTQNCVNINGLQSSVILGLTTLQQACNPCTVVVTGGTEEGHTTNSAHNQGTAVDIRSDPRINETIQYGQALAACQSYPRYGGTFLWEPKGSTCGGTVPSSNDHWHATFP